MRYSVPLTAGEAKRLPYRGRTLQLVDLGGAATVTLEVEWGDQQRVENMGAVPEKFVVKSGDVFTGLTLLASSSVTVDLLISFHDVGINPVDGSTVLLDPSQVPLPVTMSGGGRVEGVDAHDAAVTARPVIAGGVAGLSAPTSVTVGDAVRAWALPSGALVVQPHNAKQETSEGGTINWTGFINQADELRPVGVVPLLNNGGSAWRWNGGQYGGWVQGPAATDMPASGNPVLLGGAAYGAAPSQVSASGDIVPIWLSLRGNPIMGGVGVNVLDGSTSTLAQITDLAGTQRQLNVAGAVFNGNSWDRDSKATTTARLPSSAASTNATSVKASAATLHNICGATNTSGATVYVKIYNKASAPTVGTDTPVLTIPIAAGATMAPINWPRGLYLSAGLAYAITTGAADADAGAVTAGAVVGLNLSYV